MPAGFRRHLVGKTQKNAGYCNIAEIRFIGKLVIEYCLNNTINLSPLTSHIMPGYIHKMAIVSWP